LNLITRSVLVQPKTPYEDTSLINRITASEAEWRFLNAGIRRLYQDETWSTDTGEFETVLVILGGQCSVATSRNTWEKVGRRPDVFSGMPHAVYLPRRSRFQIKALTPKLEVAYCWISVTTDHGEQWITPDDSTIEIRGGGHATRQINSIIPPGFDCERLVCVEVFTPGGNWSSYPPHKHDVHRTGPSGEIVEADLEEIYYYKIRRPQGYAIQRVYTKDHSLDQTVAAYSNDMVLVPEGYHPVSAPCGYDCYYLNFLAGSAQSLANSDDPDHAWIKENWGEPDPRLPMVTHVMEKGDACERE
jgi:5-deoxy-glucuronate isomerase